MGSSPEEIAKHVKVYLTVFAGLLLGTILTVAMYSVHFEQFAITVVVALFIAAVKAFLVAAYFMHLISEKTAIYAIMASTVFFVASLMALTLFAFGDIPSLAG